MSALDVRRKQILVDKGEPTTLVRSCLQLERTLFKLSIPGASDSQLYYLRTFADSRALVAKAESAKQAIIVGASFIGLEVATSLRERGVGVHVVAPEQRPLERVLGLTSGGLYADFMKLTLLSST